MINLDEIPENFNLKHHQMCMTYDLKCSGCPLHADPDKPYICCILGNGDVEDDRRIIRTVEKWYEEHKTEDK